MSALQVRGLSVSFRNRGGLGAAANLEVLHGVDLSLEAGTCVAVVGESGAGKSVLARCLVGLASEGGAPAHVTADQLVIAGRDMRQASERLWRSVRGSRVGFVLQDALQSLDPLRTVGAEVEEALRLRRIPRAERHRRTLAALSRVGLPDSRVQIARLSGQMSGGMRQRALIASAIIAEPAVLIADEPTTALDATAARGILELLASLRDAGTAVLLVTHDLGAVARVADEVIVLDAGRVVESGPTARVLDEPRHPVTRALIDAIPRGPKLRGHRSPAHGGHAPSPQGQPVLEGRAVPALRATGLRRTYRLPTGEGLNALDNVDLIVQPGEALGVVGESGSGKTTLARLLLSIEAPDAGHVELFGDAWSQVSERDRRARRQLIQHIPQDPLGSFDPRLSAGQILNHAIQAAAGSRPSQWTAAALLDLAQLPVQTLHRRPRSLSGGQRQRLAIARALSANPDVLIADEPVSALDVTVQRTILELLARLQQEFDLAMVFISHDLAVVRRLCDTVAVMHQGRVVEEGPTEHVWAQPQHQTTRALLAATFDKTNPTQH